MVLLSKEQKIFLKFIDRPLCELLGDNTLPANMNLRAFLTSSSERNFHKVLLKIGELSLPITFLKPVLLESVLNYPFQVIDSYLDNWCLILTGNRGGNFGIAFLNLTHKRVLTIDLDLSKWEAFLELHLDSLD